MLKLNIGLKTNQRKSNLTIMSDKEYNQILKDYWLYMKEMLEAKPPQKVS